MHHLGSLPRRHDPRRIPAPPRRRRPRPPPGNTAPLIALARNYPQEARTWSEGPLLAQMGRRVSKEDAKTANETLSIVRKLGRHWLSSMAVYSVADIVAAIDRADAEHIRILAEAHAIYRDGRLLYRDRHVAEAQEQLHRARDLFVSGGSPMSLIADYYLASCLYDSNRPTEAIAALDSVHRDSTRIVIPDCWLRSDGNKTFVMSRQANGTPQSTQRARRGTFSQDLEKCRTAQRWIYSWRRI